MQEKRMLNLGKVVLLKRFFYEDRYIFQNTHDSIIPAYKNRFFFYIENDIVMYVIKGDIFQYSTKIAEVGKVVKNDLDGTFSIEALPGYGVRLADLLDKVSQSSDFKSKYIGLTDDKRYWVYERPGIDSIFAEIKTAQTFI